MLNPTTSELTCRFNIMSTTEVAADALLQQYYTFFIHIMYIRTHYAIQQYCLCWYLFFFSDVCTKKAATILRPATELQQ